MLKKLFKLKLVALTALYGFYFTTTPMEKSKKKTLTLREFAEQAKKQQSNPSRTGNEFTAQSDPNQVTTQLIKIGVGYNPYKPHEHEYANIPQHPYDNIPAEFLEKEKESSSSESDDEDWNFLHNPATTKEEKIDPRINKGNTFGEAKEAMTDLWVKTKRKTQKLSSEMTNKFKELSTKNPTFHYAINNLSGQRLLITVTSKNKSGMYTKPNQPLDNDQAIILTNITDPNIHLSVRPDKATTISVEQVYSWDIKEPGSIIFKKDSTGTIKFDFISFANTTK